MTVSSAEIAQLVEHFTRNEGVVGSSPIFSLLKNRRELSIYRGFAGFTIFIFANISSKKAQKYVKIIPFHCCFYTLCK